jgi:hypothetical protein
MPLTNFENPRQIFSITFVTLEKCLFLEQAVLKQ